MDDLHAFSQIDRMGREWWYQVVEGNAGPGYAYVMVHGPHADSAWHGPHALAIEHFPRRGPGRALVDALDRSQPIVITEKGSTAWTS